MEARAETVHPREALPEARPRGEKPPLLPPWALFLLPLALIVGAIGLFALLGGPGLGERIGPPAEEIAVERTALRPGEIQLTLRNDGPDAVAIEGAAINDAFVPLSADGGRTVGRLGSATVTIPFGWIEGEAYEIALLTSTGGTIEHGIEVAVETPVANLGFFGLMALLGVYVGVIPVSMGMLWLPFVRRVGRAWIGALIAFTVGLLAFLGIDAGFEGLEIASEGPSAFGGPTLVFLGALIAYLVLSGVDAHLSGRQQRRRAELASTADGAGRALAGGGIYLALLVSIGIGLHNLGEGLAIGSAYAVGALALGTFLVVGFAIHNTTEGLAIVSPLADERPPLRRLVALGLIAGGPAVLGAWIGAGALNPSVAALLFGVGVGAIAQVIRQLVPTLRDADGRVLNPTTVTGLLAGLAAMYLTGLLVSV